MSSLLQVIFSKDRHHSEFEHIRYYLITKWLWHASAAFHGLWFHLVSSKNKPKPKWPSWLVILRYEWLVPLSNMSCSFSSLYIDCWNVCLLDHVMLLNLENVCSMDVATRQCWNSSLLTSRPLCIISRPEWQLSCFCYQHWSPFQCGFCVGEAVSRADISLPLDLDVPVVHALVSYLDPEREHALC